MLALKRTERFPDGIQYQVAYDITPFIRDSVQDVVQTLFEAVALVALVVLVFLQSWRAVLIPRAQGLGLRLPADSEIIILQVPNPERQ